MDVGRWVIPPRDHLGEDGSRIGRRVMFDEIRDWLTGSNHKCRDPNPSLILLRVQFCNDSSHVMSHNWELEWRESPHFKNNVTNGPKARPTRLSNIPDRSPPRPPPRPRVLQLHCRCRWLLFPSPPLPLQLTPHPSSMVPTVGAAKRPQSVRAGPRRAPAGRPRSDGPRRSNGPLSAAAMSTFRCPTRQDFLQTVGAVAPSRARPRSKSFAAPGEREKAWQQQQQYEEDAMPNTPADDDEADDDEVPPHLGAALLDAMDKLEETPELKAIATWLDDVRTRHNFPLRITDVDLSNGVALLDALYVVDAGIFADVEYANDADTPRPYVLRELDADGENASKNRHVLRQMLSKFPWRDVDDGGRALKPVDFDRVDTWALGGFVVLAAYSCERGREFATQMVGYDDWVTAALEDVMWRGLQALGATPRPTDDSCGEPSVESSCPSDALSGSVGAEDGGDDELYWKGRAREVEKEKREQQRKREAAERRAIDAEGKADAWQTAHAGLERAVARLTTQAADATAEVRRLRAKRGVFREANGDEEGRREVAQPQKAVGRAVNQLRTENARLRRKVAELEKKAGEVQKELGRVRREGRRRGPKVGGARK